MSIKRLYILLTLLLSSVSFVYSQERSLTDIYVEFLVNHSVLDPDFGDNAARLDEIISLIDKINTDSTLSAVLPLRRARSSSIVACHTDDSRRLSSMCVAE